jgi:hypothetical protein
MRRRKKRRRSIVWYHETARKAESYIKEQIAKCRSHITYWELNDFLNIDRMTGWYVLGWLVKLNYADRSPLWCSFVGYKDDRYGERGMPGSCFCVAARNQGFDIAESTIAERNFVYEQRQKCIEVLRSETN